MDAVKMVEELRTERAQIEEAIMALETLGRAYSQPQLLGKPVSVPE
jgi:hypothetical protein